MSENEMTPVEESPDAGLAGRGARLGAYLIDWILVSVITGVIGYMTGLLERLMNQDTTATLLLAAIGLVVYGVINGRLLATRGQTVGKKLVGVRIVDAPTRQIVAVWKSFGLRVAVIQAITAVPLVGALFGAAGRALHLWRASTVSARPARRYRRRRGGRTFTRLTNS